MIKQIILPLTFLILFFCSWTLADDSTEFASAIENLFVEGSDFKTLPQESMGTNCSPWNSFKMRRELSEHGYTSSEEYQEALREMAKKVRGEVSTLQNKNCSLLIYQKGGDKSSRVLLKNFKVINEEVEAKKLVRSPIEEAEYKSLLDKGYSFLGVDELLWQFSLEQQSFSKISIISLKEGPPTFRSDNTSSFGIERANVGVYLRNSQGEGLELAQEFLSDDLQVGSYKNQSYFSYEAALLYHRLFFTPLTGAGFFFRQQSFFYAHSDGSLGKTPLKILGPQLSMQGSLWKDQSLTMEWLLQVNYSFGAFISSEAFLNAESLFYHRLRLRTPFYFNQRPGKGKSYYLGGEVQLGTTMANWKNLPPFPEEMRNHEIMLGFFVGILW